MHYLKLFSTAPYITGIFAIPVRTQFMNYDHKIIEICSHKILLINQLHSSKFCKETFAIFTL